MSASPQLSGRLASFRVALLGVDIPERSREQIPVLVAETLAQHRQGLSGAGPHDLRGCAGMFFSFPRDTRTPVSMTEMAMPLDVAFLDAAGVVSSTVELDPVPATRRASYRGHLPPAMFRYALELLQGGAARFGIAPGVRIDLSGV
jgi:uncharacterized membrane protein (UPF0127 family)